MFIKTLLRFQKFSTKKPSQKLRERQSKQQQKKHQKIVYQQHPDQQFKVEKQGVLSKHDKNKIKNPGSVYKNSDDNQIPKEQILFHSVLLLPVLFQGVPIDYMIDQLNNGQYTIEQINTYMKYCVKYSAVHVCIYSGIHWGMCFVEDDIETYGDTVKEELNDLRFICASMTALLSFGVMNTLCYMNLGIGVKSILMSGYSILHLGLLYMDRMKGGYKTSPKWYHKLKLMVVLAFIVGNSCMAYMVYINRNTNKINFQDPNIFKKYMEPENINSYQVL